MIINQPKAGDMPRMIELLRSSLGESLMPKSEAFFIWKHEQNPFGPSKILLAREEGLIIGLRAFMQWDWVSGDKKIKAVRAVDTATDPAHQGKGIFRKLTLQAVDECKAEGVSLVYNTPNPISMAGYLKMGWQQAGRMPILIGPGSIFPRFYREEEVASMLLRYPVDRAIGHLRDHAFHAGKDQWHTPLSHAYLHWRYHTCPVVKYGAVSEAGRYGFVFRLKRLNRFYELRICEAWTESTDKQAPGDARRALRQLIGAIRPLMVTCAPSPDFMQGDVKPGWLLGPVRKGPMVTIRPLAMDNLTTFDQFSQWQPSMGTMELF